VRGTTCSALLLQVQGVSVRQDLHPGARAGCMDSAGEVWCSSRERPLLPAASHTPCRVQLLSGKSGGVGRLDCGLLQLQVCWWFVEEV
jgi:hypothetical protein